MAFRDETEALQARADTLQRDLDQAHKEIGRLQVEHREATDEATKLRDQVAAFEARSGAPPRSKVPLMVVALLVLLGVIGGFVFVRGGAQQAQFDAQRNELESRNEILQKEMRESLHALEETQEELRMARRLIQPTPPELPAPAPAPMGTEQAPRDEIVAAMRSARDAVARCASGLHGTAQVQIVFAPSGRVTLANVTGGPFEGTPAALCIARAMRAVHVSPYDGAPTTVNFPFVIQ